MRHVKRSQCVQYRYQQSFSSEYININTQNLFVVCGRNHTITSTAHLSHNISFAVIITIITISHLLSPLILVFTYLVRNLKSREKEREMSSQALSDTLERERQPPSLSTWTNNKRDYYYLR